MEAIYSSDDTGSLLMYSITGIGNAEVLVGVIFAERMIELLAAASIELFFDRLLAGTQSESDESDETSPNNEVTLGERCPSFMDFSSFPK